jgi:CheY-like chemotaxis protein
MTEASPLLNDVSLEQLLAGLAAVRDGDLSVRVPGSADPLLDEIAAAFNEMAARLAEQDAERSRFLPALSHELRTPLNSMLVLAGLLAGNPDGNLTPGQVEYANVIHSAGTDLASVIGRMIDPDAAEGEPEGQPDAITAERRLLVVEETRGGLLTLLARGTVSDLAGGDPVVVRTAIAPGEVSSALAAGSHLCVVLDLGASETLATETLVLARTVRVPVLTHGRGEAERAQFALLRAKTGTDLAELVSSPEELRQKIAWHMSGTRDGATALASLVVPAQPVHAWPVLPAPAPVEPVPPPEPFAELRGRKILVVDDDPRNVFAITSTLEHHGMMVISAASGQAGIDLLARERDTDLVLMDLMMPGMDGYATISAIRNIPDFSDLPVIAVTAHTVTGDLEKEIPGADGCVTKPLDTDDLLHRMSRLLRSLPG